MSPVLVERWALVVGGRGKLHWRSKIEPRELPEEWVLRQLGDSDLEDDDAVAALLKDYGAITWPYFDPATIPEDRCGLLAPSSVEERSDWWERRRDGTLEDARWWLKTARALAGTWREALDDDGDPAAAWSAEGFTYPDDERSCWAHFTSALNIGLRSFSARAELRAQTPYGEVIHGLPRVGLYSAACRQIFNFIVEEHTARRCENQTCGRVFVHQLGGAQYRQYRSTGLRFCSPQCARAETQRQYRRRNAARKKEQP